MNTPRSTDEELRRIDLAAADWLIRGERGLGAEEQDDFFRWLAEDPRHGEYFSRHRQTWRELNKLAQWRPEHSDEPNPDLLARRKRLSASPASIFTATTRTFWIRAAILAAAACATVTFFIANGWVHVPVQMQTAPMASTGYERRELEDGSVAELNRGAAIVVSFDANERRVRLVRGEALFTVAKNPDRPFIVRAGAVDVRAIGTAFNVRLSHKDVEVVVTEGKVTVQTDAEEKSRASASAAQAPATSTDPAAAAGRSQAGTKATSNERPAPMFVSAGQKVVVPLTPENALEQPTVADVSASQLSQILAWQPRLLEFDSTPLAEVVATFNRHNDAKLVLADPELAPLPIVATFRSDNLESFVTLLEKSQRVRVEREGATLTLRTP